MQHKAKEALSKVLNPYSYDDFFEKIIGKKPLILLDKDEYNRANLLGSDPKKCILSAFNSQSHKLTCHALAPTSPPPQAHKVTSENDYLKLIREYHNKGYTVRIPESSNLSPDLHKFIRSLEIIFSNPADVVVFWSNPGAKAPVHHDEYDLICIQLLGEKKWFISEDQPTLTNTWKKIGEAPPLLEQYQTIDVSPGDLIYLPRGTAHTVQSTTESIHLSIGFTPVTTRDSIIAVLDYLSDSDKSLRECPSNRADNITENKELQTTSKSIKRGIEKLLEKCQSDQFIADALKFRWSRVIVDLPKIPSTNNTSTLNINSLIKHNDLAVANMYVTEKTIDLCLPSEHLLIHKGTEESMRYILASPEFKIADIPGEIGDDVRIALVERLIVNGFLEPAHT